MSWDIPCVIWIVLLRTYNCTYIWVYSLHVYTYTVLYYVIYILIQYNFIITSFKVFNVNLNNVHSFKLFRTLWRHEYYIIKTVYYIAWPLTRALGLIERVKWSVLRGNYDHRERWSEACVRVSITWCPQYITI